MCPSRCVQLAQSLPLRTETHTLPVQEREEPEPEVEAGPGQPEVAPTIDEMRSWPELQATSSGSDEVRALTSLTKNDDHSLVAPVFGGCGTAGPLPFADTFRIPGVEAEKQRKDDGKTSKNGRDAVH